MSARFTESVMLEQFQLPEDCLCNNFQKTKEQKKKPNKHTQKNINNMEASYNQKYDYKKKTKTKMKNPDYTLTLKKK